MDVQILPVFYRTSSPFGGRCPKNKKRMRAFGAPCEGVCVYLATPRQFGLRIILSPLGARACVRVCVCVCVCVWVCFAIRHLAAPQTRFGCTMGRMHCDSKPLKSVMSHSLIRSLVCLHRSLTRLLRTARFILLGSLTRRCVR